MADVPAEIGPEKLPKTSLECYRYGNHPAVSIRNYIASND
jgi:hypothetical protein